MAGVLPEYPIVPGVNMGKLRTKLEDMQIGDRIACRYDAAVAGSAGTFSNLGGNVDIELPVKFSAKNTSKPTSGDTAGGWFYLYKVDKGKLIADRMIQHSISWDALNRAGYIHGAVCDVRKVTDPLKGTERGKVMICIPSLSDFEKYMVRDETGVGELVYVEYTGKVTVTLKTNYGNNYKYDGIYADSIKKNENIWHPDKTKSYTYGQSEYLYDLYHLFAGTTNRYHYSTILQDSRSDVFTWRHILQRSDDEYMGRFRARIRTDAWNNNTKAGTPTKIYMNDTSKTLAVRSFVAKASNSGKTHTARLYMHFCFRPMFLYVDNEKSTNLFY